MELDEKSLINSYLSSNDSMPIGNITADAVTINNVLTIFQTIQLSDGHIKKIFLKNYNMC